MSSVNKATLLGRLGSDPSVRYTQANTAVATLSLATSMKYTDKNGEKQENTEWHRVIAWGKLAEICQQYLAKGSQIYLEGYLQTRSWEDKEGIKRYTTEIVMQQMTMLGSKADNDRPPNPGNNNQGKSQAQSNVLDGRFDDLDDDLPF